jgi:hypothetical protein
LRKSFFEFCPFNQIDLSTSSVQEIEGLCLRIAQETKSSYFATFVNLANFASWVEDGASGIGRVCRFKSDSIILLPLPSSQISDCSARGLMFWPGCLRLLQNPDGYVRLAIPTGNH